MTISVYPPMPTQDWYLAVARGQIGGASQVNIYGYQSALSTTMVPIWENVTAYTYPASASTMLLYSSSASDTNVSILINGLDSNYAPSSETLVLTNGTTGVTTTKSYIRINSISVAGSTAPVGVIYLSNAGKTQTYAQINLTSAAGGGSVSAGRSQMNIYTVPAGYTFYLTRVNAYATTDNSSSKFVNYQVYSRNITTGAVQYVAQAPFTGSYTALRISPRAYGPKTDIQWQCSYSSGTAAIGIAVEGVLILGS